ncbi:MAG: hypothetical protein JW878_02330 [Methanomicrobia archaeon]|nr:hypothetical protein [Methanomicrobia archaeon]
MTSKSTEDILVGDHVYYRRNLANPLFECRLQTDHELAQKLITDPGSLLGKKKSRKDSLFWLRILLEGICTGGLFVFETSIPQGTNSEFNVAARTLFLLDGDMLVKIDKTILTRTDAVEIIRAHCGWSTWCLTQLRGASFLRRFRWLLITSGVAAGGVLFFLVNLRWYLVPTILGPIMMLVCGTVMGLIAPSILRIVLKITMNHFL